MEANAETRDRAPEKGRGASGPGGGPDERLTTVRAIAGKIAHDLNNLLTLLQAYPGLILKALPKGAREAQYIGEIEQTVRDMTRLTQQLLWVSRGGRVAPQPCLLNEIVDQALAQMKDTLPAGMTVEFLPTGQLRRVEAIPEQIVLAVQQVCQNAVDAMGDRGVVRLTTENIHLSGPLSHEVRVEPGDYVRVTVSDSGRGIPDEIRDRIYDPNVSTKKSSGRRGAGLGLAIVRSIMMDHNGYVGFETAAGEGTTFSLYFPAREGEGAVEGGEGEPPGGRSVLIADDEEPIRELFARIIEAELGDVVTDTAADGREAVESFRQRRHSVVVMDLHMPGMNGREAFAEIEKMCGEKRWPMPAVIFCTGFALPEALDRIIADGRRHCLLRKPVGPDLLVRTVKERLGSGHADH